MFGATTVPLLLPVINWRDPSSLLSNGCTVFGITLLSVASDWNEPFFSFTHGCCVGVGGGVAVAVTAQAQVESLVHPGARHLPHPVQLPVSPQSLSSKHILLHTNGPHDPQSWLQDRQSSVVLQVPSPHN